MKSKRITRRSKTRRNKKSRITRRKGGQGSSLGLFTQKLRSGISNIGTSVGLTFKPIPTFTSCPLDSLPLNQQYEITAFLDEFGQDQYPNDEVKRNQLKAYYYRIGNCDKLLAAINRWKTPGEKELIIKEYGLNTPDKFGKRKLYRYLSSLIDKEKSLALRQQQARGY